MLRRSRSTLAMPSRACCRCQFNSVGFTQFNSVGFTRRARRSRRDSGRRVARVIIVRYMWLPEAVDLDALLRVRFAGPSVAIIDGEQRAQCGHAANEALHKSRQGVAELLAQRRGLGFGLLLVHSPRQRSLQFEQHARMMSLIARMRPDAGLLHQLSLLLVNNDASELLPHGAWHGNTDNPLKWLELYALPLRIRMLLVTSINIGYNCGELQALVAAAPVLQQFPWVLYCSGPDVLPTPAGIFRMGAEVVRSWNKRHGSRSATNPAAAAALLYLRFPAPRHACGGTTSATSSPPCISRAASLWRRLRTRPSWLRTTPWLRACWGAGPRSQNGTSSLRTSERSSCGRRCKPSDRACIGVITRFGRTRAA